MGNTIVFKSPKVSTAPGLVKLRKDPVLRGDNDGVRFLFDLGSSLSWASQADPANADAIIDIAEHGNGTALKPAGSITFAGKGFDFTASSGLPSGIAAPSSVLADIQTAVGGKAQRYLAVMYCKLPSAANWNSTTLMQSLMGDRNYTNAASLFSLGQRNLPGVDVRRQVAAATPESGSFFVTPIYETFVQIAVWRSDAGQGLRIKSAAATNLSTLPIGVDNTQDFSGNQFVFGRPNAFGVSGVTAMMTGFRVYRGWIENLARSGRDPVTVLDADWARIVARGDFS